MYLFVFIYIKMYLFNIRPKKLIQCGFWFFLLFYKLFTPGFKFFP